MRRGFAMGASCLLIAGAAAADPTDPDEKYVEESIALCRLSPTLSDEDCESEQLRSYAIEFAQIERGYSPSERYALDPAVSSVDLQTIARRCKETSLTASGALNVARAVMCAQAAVERANREIGDRAGGIEIVVGRTSESYGIGEAIVTVRNAGTRTELLVVVKCVARSEDGAPVALGRGLLSNLAPGASDVTTVMIPLEGAEMASVECSAE